MRWARPNSVLEGGRAAHSGHNLVIVKAPFLRVLSPGVREIWILLGDDFSTVFPFSAQCFARQWLYVLMFKSCGVARCSDWKMFTEVGEGENTSGFGLRMCMLTLCGRHWLRQWLHVLAPVYGGLEESRSPASSGPPERDFTVLADFWHVADVHRNPANQLLWTHPWGGRGQRSCGAASCSD